MQHRLVIWMASCTLAAIGFALLLRGNTQPAAYQREDDVSRAIYTLFCLAACFALMIAIPSVIDDAKPDPIRSALVEYFIVTVFAGLVGFAELTQRYRDDPIKLFSGAPTLVYVNINALSGVAALALAKDFELFKGDAHQKVYQIMLASFGAIAFFRSSLFTARIGKEDLDIGPSTLLKSLLATVDTTINRSQAVDRSQDIVDIMAGVDFEKAKAALPTLCFVLVENVPDDVQKAVGNAIGNLSNQKELQPTEKTKILGVYLLREVGPHVLQRAVNALGDGIKVSMVAPGPQQPPATG